jgi:hypothetical protein
MSRLKAQSGSPRLAAQGKQKRTIRRPNAFRDTIVRVARKCLRPDLSYRAYSKAA